MELHPGPDRLCFMVPVATTSESEILSRVIAPESATYSRAAAVAILELHFGEDDQTRMHELASKAQAGILSANPDTGELIWLFHPRQDNGRDHFRWNGAILEYLTAIGEATIHVLGINLPHRIKLRLALIEEGVFPDLID